MWVTGGPVVRVDLAAPAGPTECASPIIKADPMGRVDLMATATEDSET